MRALGNPVRIELLKILQSPQTLGEIRLRPRRRDPSHRPDRFMSRVTVGEHLERLIEIGVVATRRGTADGRSVDRYVVNHRQLFALAEQLRQMASLRPGDASVAGVTDPIPHMKSEAPRGGPRLVAVNGIFEGHAFPLTAPSSGGTGWLVGRARSCHICLDYDPFLSSRNTEIRLDPDGFRVRDLPQSRNGTQVNWQTLPRGGEDKLRPGDVLTVGRSSLLFRMD